MNQIISIVNQYFNLELIKIVIFAVLCGSIFGLERLKRNKSVGIRTNIFVCLGAALFTFISTTIEGPNIDSSRVIAQIVSGIGFICGGVIFKSYNSERLVGLTTAAILWVVASIGCMIALGMGKEAIGISIVIYVINVTTYRVEKKAYKLDEDLGRAIPNFFLKDKEYQDALSGDLPLKVKKGHLNYSLGVHNLININNAEQTQRVLIRKIEYKKFAEITEEMVLDSYSSLSRFQDDFKINHPDVSPTDNVTLVFLEVER